MIYKTKYDSAFGSFILYSDGEYLISIKFENQENQNISTDYDLEIFYKTKLWLDNYFNFKKISTFNLKIKLDGSEFQKSVWNILRTIPFGTTFSYSKVGEILKQKTNKPISNQAIGNAIHKNPILLIVPCHRVIAKNKYISGFSAGVELKRRLLEFENLKIDEDFYC